MKSEAVIEGFNVIKDGGAGLGEGPEALMVNQLVFEAAKEGLDKSGVIVESFRIIRHLGTGMIRA